MAKVFEKIIKQFKKQNNASLNVGYFNGSGLNLLPSIAFWNEFGTYDIPSRPFFRNTVAKNKRKWSRNWNKEIKEQATIISKDLEYIIKSGNFEKNAPITIYGGWMRNKKSGKPFYVKGKGDKLPLTDTGKLADSIEIRISKGRK